MNGLNPELSDRGEAGKDAVNKFYEMVTALTGDQPPVVMVSGRVWQIAMVWVLISHLLRYSHSFKQ